MIRRTVIAAGALAAALCAGCAEDQPYVTPERLEHGLVVVLTGIEGRSPLNMNICKGLADGGVDCAIQLEDWTAPIGPILNLRNEHRNRQRAAGIADQLARYKQAYRNRPVFLVGQSGGGAMAAWVSEAMPPGCHLDGVVMLAASLSPDYELDEALVKSRRGIVNFYSGRDWVLLGLGTTTIGTMDSVHTVSAGAKGFEVPDSQQRQGLYRRLYQVPWTEDMADTGNVGTHMTSGGSKFVAVYVAPLIQAGHWSPELVNRVLKRHVIPPRNTLPDVKPEPGQYGYSGN
ncbi:MAG: hypothetical protein ACLFUJ_07940 [Phycisphaerae bacterium]